MGDHDYLGTHQHMAVDLDLRVDEDGAMCIQSGEQRMYEGFIGFRFPTWFSGVAEVKESWDDEIERFRIEVRVTNALLGPLFGYSGCFDVVERVCTEDDIPWDVLPVRQEQRE